MDFINTFSTPTLRSSDGNNTINTNNNNNNNNNYSNDKDNNSYSNAVIVTGSYTWGVFPYTSSGHGTSLDMMALTTPPTTTLLATDVLPSVIMSNEVFDMMVLVVGIIVIFLISALGTVLNILNIIVFTKQGLKDAVTITLFGLAVSDLGSVFTLLLMSGAYVLHFFPHLIHGLEIRYLAGFLNWPHATFVRVACLLTAFVALERCLCVVIPLHVHRIITPRVAKVYNVVILTVIIFFFGTLYSFSSVRPIFLPHLNKTVMGIWFTAKGRQYSYYMSYIVSFVYVGSFILVALLASITAIKLRQREATMGKWKWAVGGGSDVTATGTVTSSSSEGVGTAVTSGVVEARGSSQSQHQQHQHHQQQQKQQRPVLDSNLLRNQRVVKMVVVISVLFIVCTAPGLINTILFIVFPDYKQMGRYDNLYMGTSMINFALEATNSTLNFFIYLHMSSKFRQTFNKITGRMDSSRKTAESETVKTEFREEVEAP